MGSASSKVARGATRKYPSAPSASATTARVAPAARTGAQPSDQTATKAETKDDGLNSDSTDPTTITGDFSQRLQQMGVVQPNPTYSPSSTADVQSPAGIPNQTIGASQFPLQKANPTLTALDARRRFERQAELEFEEMGVANAKGRRLVDMRTLVDALQLLNRGMPQADVEKKLRMEAGLLDRLGGPAIISHEIVAYDPSANSIS